MFNYIYYRVYCVYEKKDSMPHLYSILVLTLIQSVFLLDLNIVSSFFSTNKESFFPTGKVVMIVLFGIFLLCNVLFYKNEKIEKFRNKWNDESRSKRISRGLFIVILIIIVMSFPLVVGGLRHNLGMDI